jgi:hypothetical protein
MAGHFVKIFGIGLNRWQYEIVGCMMFYILGIIGILTYLSKEGSWPILIPSTFFIILGIFSPINVYFKEKRGYYDDP